MVTLNFRHFTYLKIYIYIGQTIESKSRKYVCNSGKPVFRGDNLSECQARDLTSSTSLPVFSLALSLILAVLIFIPHPPRPFFPVFPISITSHYYMGICPAREEGTGSSFPKQQHQFTLPHPPSSIVTEDVVTVSELLCFLGMTDNLLTTVG